MKDRHQKRHMRISKLGKMFTAGQLDLFTAAQMAQTRSAITAMMKQKWDKQVPDVRVKLDQLRRAVLEKRRAVQSLPRTPLAQYTQMYKREYHDLRPKLLQIKRQYISGLRAYFRDEMKGLKP